ncbi:MAG TPA: lysophospholipid acyltransferase family protein [Myxococcota bacterium]|nr:lysophospholipid acyltransferase family protein [Myxococcota bacterium]
MSRPKPIRATTPARQADAPRRSWPRLFGALRDELEARIARIPTRLNQYGFDSFGLEPGLSRRMTLPMIWIYRHYLRVETRGIERVPEGRVLLIANHAGNTFAWDGAMLVVAMLLEAEPPRIVRGMGEYYLPTLPFFNVWMQRAGSVVGTPENCAQLLSHGEAIMVFPEGARGFVKSFRHRYELQQFGLGFMRLALSTRTPIMPVGIVGAEEQSPGIANLRGLGRLFGSPAFPVTLTFPWLGLASFLPLPVKFRLHFGRPLHFEGDPDEDDAAVEAKVEIVKQAIRALVADGLAARTSWFS